MEHPGDAEAAEAPDDDDEFGGDFDTEDIVFKRGGAEVVVDSASMELLKGATLDYIDEMIGSQFAIVNNPNADASCGCGTSFTRKGS